MPRVEGADGTRIAYDVAGAGTPLVFLHGITEDHRLWSPIVDRLTASHRCIVMDARGHGESEPAYTGYDPFTMAADVAAVVDVAGLTEPPVVVGHSLGALMATVYAAGGLGPVRGVVNVDQSLRLTDFVALIRPLRAELEGDGFDDFMASFPDMLGVDALPAQAAARVRAYDRARRDVVLGIWGPLFEATDEELTALIETELLPNVHVPYLALHGPDPGAGYIEWLTSHVHTARVEVWGGGHWVHLGDPDRFVSRVREFATTL